MYNLPSAQTGNEKTRLRLARTLQAEAGNQGFQGMLDVGSVIANRAGAGNYGKGIDGVIMKPGQFSAWNSVTGYAGGEQGQNMNFQPNAEAMRAADVILSGNFEDQTSGATHYYNPSISQPKWGNDSFVRRGDHVFGKADAGNARARRPARNKMGLNIQPNGAPSQPEKRKGLLGGIFGDNFQPNGAPSQPEKRKGLLGGIFGDNFQDEDKYALAMALSGMSMRPNQGLQAALKMKMKNAQSTRVTNKTVNWLMQNGREDLAQAVEGGAIDGRTAASLFYQRPEDDRTALMKNAEYIMKQNPEMTFNDALQYAKGGQTINVNGAPQVGTIPQGYQLAGGDGQPYRMEAIPGGPADISKHEAAREGEQVRQADTVLGTVNEIRELTKSGQKRAPFDLPETGIIGDSLARAGVNQEAVDVQNKIASLESAIAFDRLQRMREASPTGGALGAVSERELSLLAADLGSLKQSSSAPEFEKILNRVEKRYTEITRKFSAYPGHGGAVQGETTIDGYTIREVD